ncbi:DNA primase [Burkholderia pyrrocinia]|uniref:DNA primase n=1 Tax=Burkholderia pyrrocinia TaxID=60550 RepID=UPI001588944E|nr:DNA primase [Burkholderia pyrrocinia]
MSVDLLLSRLASVRHSGPHRWQARCPAHNDHGPSLAVRELDDGRLLVHCFAGCGIGAVMDAVGLTVSDLFPAPIGGPVGLKPERHPFPAMDVLACIRFEALVVATAGVALLDGYPFAVEDRARLVLAVKRINAALDAAGVPHE